MGKKLDVSRPLPLKNVMWVSAMIGWVMLKGEHLHGVQSREGSFAIGLPKLK